MNDDIRSAFDRATGAIQSSFEGMGKAFALSLMNPTAYGFNLAYQQGKQSAPAVGDAVKQTLDSTGNALSNGLKSVGDFVTAPLRATGKYIDNTTTKILIIGALALVGVVLVKKIAID